MTILDDFGAELVHDLRREPFVSEDEFGNPTYGAAQMLKARTDFTRRNYINARGQLAEVRGESWFAPLAAGVRDRFTIFHPLVAPAGEVVQNLDVSPIDDDLGVPYATRLIFG